MVITDIDVLKRYLKLAFNRDLAFDTETSGVKLTHGDYICGISMAFRDDNDHIQTCYIPVRHRALYDEEDVLELFRDEEVVNIDEKECFDLLRRFFSKTSGKLIAHNAKFDITAFMCEGIHIQEVEDTMIMFTLLYPEKRMGLKKIMKSILGEEPVDTDNVKRWLSAHSMELDSHGFEYVPIEILAPYAEKDAEATLRIYELLVEDLDGNTRKIYEIEKRVIPILAFMQIQGLPIDMKIRDKLLLQVLQDMEKVKRSIFKLAGKKFELNNPEEVATVLFDAKEGLGLPVPKIRPGDGLTDVRALSKIDHPIAVQLMAYRKLEKLRGTYLESMNQYEYKGKVHTTYNQVKSVESDTAFTEGKVTGTETGRLSSRDPNLQNIARPIEVSFYDL